MASSPAPARARTDRSGTAASDGAGQPDEQVEHPDPPWRLGYRPALDGLRGIGILVVMAAHLHLPLPFMRRGGSNAVTMFFVLSGFLITALLVEERRRDGSISLRRFFGRRALRLLPAFAVAVVALVLLGAVTTGDALWALSYGGNWHRAGGATLGFLGHTWSLSVEEQFYLIWPVVFALFAKRPRVLWALLVIGIGASAVARVVLFATGASQDRVYFGSDTRADAILIGCAMALLATSGRWRRPGALMTAVAVVAFGAVSLAGTDWLFYQVGLGVVAVASAVLIAASCEGRLRFLTWKPLCQIGVLSYALYIWHVPVMRWSHGYFGETVAWYVVSVTASFALAFASKVLVERPFLEMKSRLADRRSTSERVVDRQLEVVPG